MTARLVLPTLGNRPRYEPKSIITPRTLESPTNRKPWPEYGGKKWWGECGRKQAYFTRQDAIEVNLIMGHRPKHGRKLVVYPCPWCEWYHLGHERKPDTNKP